MRRTLPIGIICMLALCSARGTAITDDGEEWLYLGQHTTLAAAPPRQLTLNDNVVQFQYSPDGYRLAYIAQPQDPDASPELGVVSTIIPTSGRAPRPTVFDNLGWGPGGVTLGDWSSDGTYLAASATVLTNQGADNTQPPETRQQLESVNLATNKASVIPEPDEPGKSVLFTVPGTWAPGVHLFAYSTLTARGSANNPDVLSPSRGSQLVVYDADSRQSRVIDSQDDAFFRPIGWIDNHQLCYSERKSGQLSNNFTYDLQTGTTTEAGPHLRMFSISSADSGLQTIPIRAGISLSLNAESARLTDSAKQSHGAATRLWVVREGSLKPEPDPSSPPRPTRPILLVDTYPSDQGTDYGRSCPPRFRPLGIFGRESKYQVAYVSHGDLKVVDLSPRSATPREVYAGGDDLSCPDELQLAMDNAKQIGLALIQYTQDYDENYPSSANFSNGVQPYLNDPTIMQLGGHQFRYDPPAKLGLADLDNPSETVIGEFDMPCGKANVYADGHVKIGQ